MVRPLKKQKLEKYYQVSRRIRRNGFKPVLRRNVYLHYNFSCQIGKQRLHLGFYFAKLSTLLFFLSRWDAE